MQIHTVIYKGSLPAVEMREVTAKYCSDYIPNKRVYPGKCDLEFCGLLMMKGFRIPFTFYEEPDCTGDFNGLILENLVED